MTDNTRDPAHQVERVGPQTHGAPDPNSLASSSDENREMRAIADQMMTLLEQLKTLEERKRNEAMGSDEFVALAVAAEAQGRLVFRWSGIQLDVAREAARRMALGQVPRDLRIADVQPRRMDRLLAAWREAQVRFDLAKPGSPEASEAADAIERLRDEYQAATAPPAAQRVARDEAAGLGEE